MAAPPDPRKRGLTSGGLKSGALTSGVPQEDPLKPKSVDPNFTRSAPAGLTSGGLRSGGLNPSGPGDPSLEAALDKGFAGAGQMVNGVYKRGRFRNKTPGQAQQRIEASHADAARRGPAGLTSEPAWRQMFPGRALNPAQPTPRMNVAGQPRVLAPGVVQSRKPVGAAGSMETLAVQNPSDGAGPSMLNTLKSPYGRGYASVPGVPRYPQLNIRPSPNLPARNDDPDLRRRRTA